MSTTTPKWLHQLLALGLPVLLRWVALLVAVLHRGGGRWRWRRRCLNRCGRLGSPPQFRVDQALKLAAV
jgi:hypothetical protein